MQTEHANGKDNVDASVIRGANHVEKASAKGFYEVECFDKDGNLKWRDIIENVVCQDGMNAMLTQTMKGSGYTAVIRMGLITNTGYSAPANTNTAANIATSASANGWEEAPAATCATRSTPTMGTAAVGALATSANVAFSIVGTDIIKGVFFLIPSASSVNPTSTVGNTSGALWSAGTFTGGDKSVGNGDTLNVSYTTSL